MLNSAVHCPAAKQCSQYPKRLESLQGWLIGVNNVLQLDDVAVVLVKCPFGAGCGLIESVILQP